MEKTKRRIIRHILAGVFIVLGILGGLLPVLQGWMFILLAIIILAVDYRWIRDLVLRRLYRWFPNTYRKATRARRRMRIGCSRRFGRKKSYHPIHPPSTHATSPAPATTPDTADDTDDPIPKSE